MGTTVIFRKSRLFCMVGMMNARPRFVQFLSANIRFICYNQYVECEERL